MRRRLRAVALAGAVLGSLAGGHAYAQSLAPRTLFVDDRGTELFDTEGGEGGIRAGAFDVRAAAGIAYGYDSNVYAAPDAEQDDSLAVGEALIRAVNKSATRDTRGLAYVRARRYDQARDQDATEYGALGSFDGWFGSQNHLVAGFGMQRNVESRSDIETPTDIPVSIYDDLRATFGYGRLLNRLGLDTRVDARRVQYDSPGQEFRDRYQYRGELRVAYDLRGDLSFLTTAYYNRDEFDDPGTFTLNADTVGGLVGIRFDVPDLLDLELGAGYFERRFENGVAPLEGVSFRAAVDWQPSRLIGVRIEALRSDAPTRIEGAFAKIRNEARIAFTHDYSRRLQLQAGLRYIADDFEDLNRLDTAWLAEFGAAWSFGRHQVIRFNYDFALRDRAEGARDFDRQVASIAWIGRL